MATKKPPQIAAGVLDRVCVRCARCKAKHVFLPQHTLSYRARVQAQALGWRYQPHVGWVCPKTHKRERDRRRVTAKPPGLDKVTR